MTKGYKYRLYICPCKGQNIRRWHRRRRSGRVDGYGVERVVVEISNLKTEDTITIMGKTNEAKAGKGRFFIDDVSIVKK